mmetsp:Transcript_50616/g.161993  ORF Transcript_50616/g.161993 Transcript_50616/m.161993 type:complete len:231 (-) Transcript_50616:22-714(-)
MPRLSPTTSPTLRLPSGWRAAMTASTTGTFVDRRPRWMGQERAPRQVERPTRMSRPGRPGRGGRIRVRGLPRMSRGKRRAKSPGLSLPACGAARGTWGRDHAPTPPPTARPAPCARGRSSARTSPRGGTRLSTSSPRSRGARGLAGTTRSSAPSGHRPRQPSRRRSRPSSTTLARAAGENSRIPARSRTRYPGMFREGATGPHHTRAMPPAQGRFRSGLHYVTLGRGPVQ